MDIERIIHSDIPDIAQVYGGVRGRTMTSKHQVALCTYWMFYGADKGIPQPELHGFLEEVGKDLLRMNQCLNAFFRKSVEKNGIEPIPIAVFKERKALIKKAWKKHVETIEDGNIPEKL